jgi:hypothetical protein
MTILDPQAALPPAFLENPAVLFKKKQKLCRFAIAPGRFKC